MIEAGRRRSRLRLGKVTARFRIDVTDDIGRIDHDDEVRKAVERRSQLSNLTAILDAHVCDACPITLEVMDVSNCRMQAPLLVSKRTAYPPALASDPRLDDFRKLRPTGAIAGIGEKHLPVVGEQQCLTERTVVEQVERYVAPAAKGCNGPPQPMLELERFLCQSTRQDSDAGKGGQREHAAQQRCRGDRAR